MLSKMRGMTHQNKVFPGRWLHVRLPFALPSSLDLHVITNLRITPPLPPVPQAMPPATPHAPTAGSTRCGESQNTSVPRD